MKEKISIVTLKNVFYSIEYKRIRLLIMLTISSLITLMLPDFFIQIFRTIEINDDIYGIIVQKIYIPYECIVCPFIILIYIFIIIITLFFAFYFYDKKARIFIFMVFFFQIFLFWNAINISNITWIILEFSITKDNDYFGILEYIDRLCYYFSKYFFGIR